MPPYASPGAVGMLRFSPAMPSDWKTRLRRSSRRAAAP